MLTTEKSSTLVSPYGNKLVNLVAPAEAIDELKARASRLPSVQLSERSVCDLELLATGAFSPLDRFMGREDHRHVLDEMRLSSGYIFPIPVTLPVEPDPALCPEQEIALRNTKNELLAVMTIEEIYHWDRAEVAQRVFGTQDSRHPLVAEMQRWGQLNISGCLQVLQLPRRYDFQELRLTPAQVRARLKTYGYQNVVAFQTLNPLHRLHEELIKRATQEVDGMLLLHPIVGMNKPGEVGHYTRVRTYKTLAENYYNPERILLALLPLAPRLAGARETVWQALIHRNYGANYLMVGQDQVDSTGTSFYEPDEAQQLVERCSDELGVKMISPRPLVYLPDENRYEEISKVPKRMRTASISAAQVRHEYLNNGKTLPAWFIRPEVAEIMAEAYPPRHRQGVCIWFTGLSGAGKSTTAEVLTARLMEHGRQVTVLDGDVVRTHLSNGLDFSKEGRDINIRRIGFVAAEIVRHGGAVICAAVSPYRTTRNDVRTMVGSDHFVEVFMDTPLEICERRDVKGFYAKARRGEIKGFTGIDDPYEPPQHAEVILDTMSYTPEKNAGLILDYLAHQGFIRANGSWVKSSGNGSIVTAP
ncbi:MAG: bifunctional sulfate adenylyltransferase/adenylylsulfate kinase [Anaerolineae bacterium]